MLGCPPIANENRVRSWFGLRTLVVPRPPPPGRSSRPETEQHPDRRGRPTRGGRFRPGPGGLGRRRGGTVSIRERTITVDELVDRCGAGRQRETLEERLRLLGGPPPLARVAFRDEIVGVVGGRARVHVTHPTTGHRTGNRGGRLCQTREPLAGRFPLEPDLPGIAFPTGRPGDRRVEVGPP